MADRKDREVLFEFQRIGQYMKVCAIDAETAVEVAVVGPATHSQELLKRIALKKLERALAQRPRSLRRDGILV